ncbi:hypothetical protein Leryth_026433 [Lithospermum erythrorhizon]|nr:hypothetical protein Leryth_026433 [Lithospermum erythrorhizon]
MCTKLEIYPQKGGSSFAQRDLETKGHPQFLHL